MALTSSKPGAGTPQTHIEAKRANMHTSAHCSRTSLLLVKSQDEVGEGDSTRDRRYGRRTVYARCTRRAYGLDALDGTENASKSRSESRSTVLDTAREDAETTGVGLARAGMGIGSGGASSSGSDNTFVFCHPRRSQRHFHSFSWLTRTWHSREAIATRGKSHKGT